MGTELVLQRTLSQASGLATGAVGRARDEAVGIWHDARTLSDTLSDRRASSDQVYLAWYAGLAAMAGLRLIQWRLAAVIAVAHTVERYGHRRRIQEFVEGFDAGL